MRIHALIPVKELANAKSRLTPPFSDVERATLTLAMLRHVVAAAQASGAFARITVVSPDMAVLDVAETLGVSALRQRTIGLNPALDEARRDARLHGAEAVLVLHADLPRLDAADITVMVRLLLISPAAVIAPDYTGSGTNALLIAPPDALSFHFGPGSFARHIAAAEQRGLPYRVAHAPGIAGDVDTPDDVRERVGSGK
ncbi:MAG: 2-phospho-L-lactate guanylyltransferase [Chloroflexota bacterium]|nr:2-phospho-L-lactate guanylyltransferase [Chloroflexota bacterium]